MHIAIDARIISSSTGRYIERLLTYLQDIDTKNHYSVLVRKKDLDFWKPRNKNFEIVEADFPDYSLAEQVGLLKLLNRLRPDLVHFCMPQQPVFYRGKSVTTIHDLTLLKTYNSDKNWFAYHFKQFIGRFVFRIVVKKSQKVIVPTEFTKKEIMERFGTPAHKLVVTLLAADIENHKPKLYNHPFSEFIMYVGQQSDYKNIKRLGDAHQKLLETHPNLGLILVGRKNASALNNEAYFKKKHYNNIIFTDFIDDAQRDWLFAECGAYIFPSLMEGFGLPGLEAMGKGAPVVSSNQTCLPEVYGNAAYYFDPYSTDDMTQKINKVLTDKKLRATLIKRGFNQFKSFSWKRCAEQTYEAYEEILR